MFSEHSFNLTWERRQTELWISIEGVPIALIRESVPVRSAAGGYTQTGAPTTLPAVQRIVSSQSREEFVQSDGVGTGAKLKKYLLGPYGDDIRVNDSFVDPTTGCTYTVEYVHQDQSIEVRAELKEVS